MLRDLFENVRERGFDAPSEIAFGIARIHDDPGDIVGPRARIGGGRVRAETAVAPGGQAR